MKKKTTIIDGKDYLNPPKGYKKPTKNQPDPKKVRAYYSKKK